MRFSAIASLVTILAAMLAPARTEAEMRAARSTHFTVYSDGGEDDLRDFAEELEQFESLMRLLADAGTDNAAPRPLPVFLFDSADDIQDTLGTHASIAGFYKATERGALMIASRDRRSRFGDDTDHALVVMFHEVAHHFMLRNFPAAYPGWFVEGFAELYSTVRFERNGKITIGEALPDRLRMIARLGLYPLDKLLVEPPQGLSDTAMGRYYATAWLLCHYLRISGERKGELDAYLRAVAGGQPSIAAANASFAGGVEGLEKDLRGYSRRSTLHYYEVKGIAAAEVPVTIAAMPESFDALYRDQVRWMTEPRGDLRQDFIDEVRRTAPRYPADPFALSLLAEADYAAGDLDAAERAADAAIAVDPSDIRAWVRKAYVAMDRAEKADPKAAETLWRAAKDDIVAANRADHDAPRPLIANYHLYLRMGERPNDLAFSGLLRAFELLPQCAELRLETAFALAMRDRKKDAAALLAPLVNDPHDSRVREAARTARAAFLRGTLLIETESRAEATN
jgi:tetratricopeptide (TPR) repeat protein